MTDDALERRLKTLSNGGAGRVGGAPYFNDWGSAEVPIFSAWGWVNAILKVESVDKERHTPFVNCEQDIRPGNRFFIANVRQVLDASGE